MVRSNAAADTLVAFLLSEQIEARTMISDPTATGEGQLLNSNTKITANTIRVSVGSKPFKYFTDKEMKAFEDAIKKRVPN
jgi:hypothetical protein